MFAGLSAFDQPGFVAIRAGNPATGTNGSDDPMIYTTHIHTRCMAAILAGIASVLIVPDSAVVATDSSAGPAPLPRQRIAPDPAGAPNPAGAQALAGSAQPGSAEAETPEDPAAGPVEGTIEHAELVLQEYASQKGWGTEMVKDGKGNPEALRIFLPSPLKGIPAAGSDTAASPGKPDTVLPLLPQSYLGHFRQVLFKPSVGDLLPFRHVDIVWSTGAETVKADDGFAQPHIDVHFARPAPEQAAALKPCPSDDETCAPPSTVAEMAARLSKRPDRCFLPQGIVAIADRTPPETGLYNLASGPEQADADASTDNPNVLYGTFDGEIVFLGASLTLATLQQAAAEANMGERLSWPISQPAKYRYAWWPKTIALEYRPDKGVFALSLEDFSEHEVSLTCR